MNTQSLLERTELIAQMGSWAWNIPNDQWTFSNGFRAIHGMQADVPMTTDELWTVAYPEDRPTIEQAFRDALAGMRPYDIEHRIVRALDGEVRWVHAWGEVDRDAQGQPVRLFGAMQDITDRKTAERENALLAAIVESSTDAIVGTDLDGIITSWNPGAERLYGHSAQVLIGTSLFNILAPQQLAGMPQMIARIRQGETILLPDIVWQTPDGAVVAVAVTHGPILDRHGAVIGIVSNVRDVSARHAAEAALSEAHAQLAAVMENTADLVWVVDIQYGFVMGNQAFKDVTAAAYGREFAVGESVLDAPVPDAVRNYWQQNYDRALNGERFTAEIKFSTSERWLEYHYRPITGTDDNILGVVVTGYDITERKVAEDTFILQRGLSEALLDAREVDQALEITLDTVLKLNGIDAGGIYLAAADGALDLVVHRGMPPEFIADFMHLPADWPLVGTWLEGKPTHVDRQDVKSANHPDAHRVSAVPVIVGNQVVALIAIASHSLVTIPTTVRDALYAMSTRLVSTLVRLRAEADLRTSEAQYRLLFSTSLSGIMLTDPQTGGILAANPEACHLLGRAESELRTLDRTALVDTTDIRLIPAMQERARTGKFRGELTYRRGDGTLFPVEISTSLFTRPDGRTIAAIFFTDISERKRLEAELRASKEAFQSYFNLSGAGICVTSPEKGWVEVNDRLCAMLGYAREELMGMTWAELTYPPDLAGDLALFEEVIAGTRNGYEYDKRYVCKDGSLVYTTLTVACERNLDGSVHHLIGHLIDITEAKRIAEVLRQSERKFATAFLGNPAGIAISRVADGCFLDANPAYSQMLGYTHDELVGHVSTELGLLTSDARAQIVDTVRHQTRALPFEVKLKAKTGDTMDVLTSIDIIDVDGEPCLLTMATDITERKRLEQAVREREAQLAAVLENSADFIWAIDCDYRYIFGNDAYQRVVESVFGAPLSPGERVLDRQLPDDIRKLWQSTHDRALQGETFTVEQRLRYSPQRRDVEIRYQPLLNAASEIVGVVGSGRDITERKRLEQQLARSEANLKAIVDNTADGIWSIDRDYHLQCANAGFRATVETQIGRALSPGDSVLDAPFPPQAVAFWKPNYDRALSGERFAVEMASRARPGSTLECRLTPIFDTSNAIVGVAVISIDITERKEYAQKLEIRVAERTAELNTALEELQRASELKDAFLAAVSHELRTPLMGVLGMADALELQVHGKLGDKQLHYVQQIHQSGERLLTMVNSILDYTALVAGRVKYYAEPCSLMELCAIALRSVREQSAAKLQGLSLDVDPIDLAMISDANGIIQVLSKLLDNAVKFTPNENSVGVEVKENRTQATVAISVWDTGIGISPDKLGTIFQPFEQLDHALSRQYEGVGLGLAYVQQMVRLLGGTMQVESEVGKGSRFTVLLPMKPQVNPHKQ